MSLAPFSVFFQPLPLLILYAMISITIMDLANTYEQAWARELVKTMPIRFWTSLQEKLHISDYGNHIIVILAWLAHVFESSWTIKRAIARQLPFLDIILWGFVVFLIGYPSIQVFNKVTKSGERKDK